MMGLHGFLLVEAALLGAQKVVVGGEASDDGQFT
jgi:hypothetical protein